MIQRLGSAGTSKQSTDPWPPRAASLGFLTTWRSWDSWISYMAAQGSKSQWTRQTVPVNQKEAAWSFIPSSHSIISTMLTSLPRFKGGDINPHLSIGRVSKNSEPHFKSPVHVAFPPYTSMLWHILLLSGNSLSCPPWGVFLQPPWLCSTLPPAEACLNFSELGWGDFALLHSHLCLSCRLGHVGIVSFFFVTLLQIVSILRRCRPCFLLL